MASSYSRSSSSSSSSWLPSLPWPSIAPLRFRAAWRRPLGVGESASEEDCERDDGDRRRPTNPWLVMGVALATRCDCNGDDADKEEEEEEDDDEDEADDAVAEGAGE